jgi:2-polyprenyl-3-methyl-5-hydroxy-6-metoxy-1,4-benzoquinol methylase
VEIVLAIALGLLLVAGLVHFGATRYATTFARHGEGRSPPEPSLDAAITRTARRFARAGNAPGAFYYVVGKLRTDPCTQAVARRAPLGEVLDLGCGRGQLAVLLLESGAASRVRGMDSDATKVAFAERAAVGLRARFTHEDVRAAAVEAADTVLLVDVLHYLGRAEQDALLERAARLVRPAGRLLVREVTTGLGLRTWVTVLAERIATAVGLNRGAHLVFRDVAREIVPILEANGMACTIEQCWRGTPFGNVLLVARRPG